MRTGIVRGSIEAVLPDGSTRLLGGLAPGFDAKVTIKDWRALLRLRLVELPQQRLAETREYAVVEPLDGWS